MPRIGQIFRFIPIVSLAALVVFMAGCESLEKAKEEKNKALIRRITEFWNQGNLDIVDEIIAPNYVIYSDPHDSYELQTLNHDTYKKRALNFRNMFPDTQFTVEDIVSQGDKVWLRWTYRGTHKGEFMGIDTTGKQVTVTGMTIYHIVDGKIKGHWQNLDKLGMMQQLGVIPPMGQGEK